MARVVRGAFAHRGTQQRADLDHVVQSCAKRRLVERGDHGLLLLDAERPDRPAHDPRPPLQSCGKRGEVVGRHEVLVVETQHRHPSAPRCAGQQGLEVGHEQVGSLALEVLRERGGVTTNRSLEREALADRFHVVELIARVVELEPRDLVHLDVVVVAVLLLEERERVVRSEQHHTVPVSQRLGHRACPRRVPAPFAHHAVEDRGQGSLGSVGRRG